ncbi:MAG: helix-turn-helix protein [Candidatus Saccharibacteria bacterium]|nr:helix-turn-helix protein [Candidatus Saccharibacteria bacterium]
MNQMVGTAPELALGKKLQTARQAAGMTQQTLCQRANLSYSTLAKIERGAIKSPSIFTIQSIATALGTSLDTLLDFNPAVPALKQQSKTGIRFVYFDVNGCLVRFFQKAFSDLAADTGVSADLIETAFWHYNDEVCRGTLSIEDFSQAMAHRLDTEPFDWQEYYLNALDPMPGMAELVTWVASHYQVGLLTNVIPGAIDSMRRRELLPNLHYDAIIDSSVVGAVKPEPAIYDAAAAMAGVPEDEILFIDDSRPNLITAEKRGWRVIWFDDYEPASSIERIRQALELAD